MNIRNVQLSSGSLSGSYYRGHYRVKRYGHSCEVLSGTRSVTNFPWTLLIFAYDISDFKRFKILISEIQDFFV